MLTAEVIEENIQRVALVLKFLFCLFAQWYLQTKYKVFESLWKGFESKLDWCWTAWMLLLCLWKQLGCCRSHDLYFLQFNFRAVSNEQLLILLYLHLEMNVFLLVVCWRQLITIRCGQLIFQHIFVFPSLQLDSLVHKKRDTLLMLCFSNTLRRYIICELD